MLKRLKIFYKNLGMGRVMLENSGNIGKSYRRHDEIGTPMCITVDFESLKIRQLLLEIVTLWNKKDLTLKN
jgi:glycyl-tRNA synthetase